MSDKPAFGNFIKKIKSLCFHNVGLKVLALFIAIIMWIVVININDPVTTQTYRNVPVKLQNSNLVTDAGKTMEILDDSSVVSSVVVKASRSVIRELGNSIDAVVAIADFKNLSEDETFVPIDFSVAKYSDKIESIRTSSDEVSVNIEIRKKVQLPIQATTTGEVENGYVLGDVSTAQNQVRVSGPESVISRVASASVEVQVSGFTESISTMADIVLYDKEGNVIPQKNLSLNIENVRVDAQILATKKVPIHYMTMGIPTEGYEMTGDIESDTTEVVIAGKQSVLDTINLITIPSSVLNVSGQSEDMKVFVDIAKYLPEDVVLGDPAFSGVAAVTVYIEPHTDKEFSIPLKNITIESTPDGFFAEWAERDDEVEVTLTGLAKNLETVDLSKLDCHVDFSDYARENDIVNFKAGEYELSLNMLLPEGVEAEEITTLKIRLEENKPSKKVK